MFDAKIQAIADKFSSILDSKIDDVNWKIDDKMDILYDVMGGWAEELDGLSYKMKLVIGISLGLSVADTILLFIMCRKIGR